MKIGVMDRDTTLFRYQCVKQIMQIVNAIITLLDYALLL
jgi:hypothetical protein